jgi:hypothetical protein
MHLEMVFLLILMKRRMDMNEKEEFEVPVEDRVTIKEKLSYAVGFASIDAINVVFNTFMMVYFMEVVD